MEGFISNHLIELALCARLVVAFVCGGLIGWQRKKAKGDDNSVYRTHVLICLGAALVAATSELISYSHVGVDVTRISAQVISGISFVGVGVIVKHGNAINGLTTAGTLWSVGAIGIAVGSGAFILGVVATLLILILLLTARDKKNEGF